MEGDVVRDVIYPTHGGLVQQLSCGWDASVGDTAALPAPGNVSSTKRGYSFSTSGGLSATAM